MTIDQWTEGAVTIDVAGQTVEELILLVNWCSNTEVMYSMNIPNQNAVGSKLTFVMSITCTNMQAYELKKMWENYKIKQA